MKSLIVFVVVVAVAAMGMVVSANMQLNPNRMLSRASGAADSSSPSRRISFDYKQSGKDWSGTCSSGKAQSPININTTAAVCVRHGEPTANPYRIHFHYASSADAKNLSLHHNGHTIKVKGDLGYVTVGGCNPCTGQEYRIKQFHFHAAAEHTIDADPAANRTGAYALELHIYHQKQGSVGFKDVVGVAIQFYVQPEGGYPNSFLEKINWSGMPTQKGGSTPLSGGVDLTLLKEAIHNAEYFTYTGSLTTPPCTEDVKWFVMKTPLGISQKQADTIQALFAKNTAFASGNGNNRVVQPTNGRQVVWYRRPH